MINPMVIERENLELTGFHEVRHVKIFKHVFFRIQSHQVIHLYAEKMSNIAAAFFKKWGSVISVQSGNTWV